MRTIRARPKPRMEPPKKNAARAPALSPARRRAKRKSASIVPAVASFPGSRAAPSVSPKTRNEPATSQKESGGLSRKTRPFWWGTTQSPEASISLGTSE